MAIKIKVRRFEFPNGRDKGYIQIKEEAARRGLHVFDAFGKTSELPPDGATFEVDTKHLFTNQFNTVGDENGKGGRRLFDFRIIYETNIHGGRMARRIGYIIEDDEGYSALQELRRNTLACGYCGAKYAADTFDGPGPHWCSKCTGSQYLKPTELHLLKLRPMSEHFPKRKADVPGWLVAEYRAKQRDTSMHMAEKAKAHRLENINRAIANAHLEATFIERICDAGLPWRFIDNMIRYDHKNEICFGWREKLSDDDIAEIKDAIKKANLTTYNVTFKDK